MIDNNEIKVTKIKRAFLKLKNIIKEHKISASSILCLILAICVLMLSIETSYAAQVLSTNAGSSPTCKYVLTMTYSSRTATSIKVSWTLTANLTSSSSSLGSGYYIKITVYAGGVDSGAVSLKSTSASWSGTTKHTKSGTLTVTGLSNTTTSISTALKATTNTSTSCKLSKKSGSSLAIPQNASYTVSYDANGGTSAPGNQTKWYGVNLTLQSALPVRPDYTFINWNTQADGSGTSYDAGSVYTGNAALTLYAQWSQDYVGVHVGFGL